MNGVIEWFARNGVAANLLVVFIMLAGLMSMQTLKREVFPETDSGMISVAVEYLGAAPAEVEEGVCIRIEEAIQSLEGIKQMTSTASEGKGTVMVELLPNAEVSSVLDEIKAKVDAIDTFPEEAEKPVIQEILLRKQVINVGIAGPVSEVTLKRFGEQVRDQLAVLPNITQVELANVRPYEVSIEVSEQSLRKYGLSFDEVAGAVRRSSLDLPGGSVKTEGGEILLRTKGQAYRGEDFESIILRTRRDGTRLLLSDVARVVDGFAETDKEGRFDGMPSVLIQVFRVGDQNALDISETVYAFVDEMKTRLPEGMLITTWQDDSSYLKSRQQLLVKNGLYGLLLVFLTLALFLRINLAGWVSFGLAVSFLGAFWVMPWMDVSINLLSLFAFILVLGIVVDDAIIVSENIHAHQEVEQDELGAAIRGAQEVGKPVIFAVLTTVAAFLPLLMVPGGTGKVIKVIPAVVIPTVLFSLIESLLVLPNHLSHHRVSRSRDRKSVIGAWSRFHTWFAGQLDAFVRGVYQPVLGSALRWRYLTVAGAIGIMLVTVGLIFGGWIKFQFFPAVEGDSMAAILTMPLGTPADVTRKAVDRIEASALALRDEIDGARGEGEGSVFRHVLSSVGQQPYNKTQQEGAGNFVPDFSSAHLGEVQIELQASEKREGTSSAEMANRWRELTGEIPGATELLFTASIFSSGEAINIQLVGNDFDRLRRAADELKTHLVSYAGVYDIADSFRDGKQEVKLTIKPGAEALGLSQMDLGRQVRQAFYGEEAQRIQRGRDEVRIMVRYPKNERRSLGDLEEMRIRTPQGAEVPFVEVAEVETGRGFSEIKRVDRQRAINVTAEVDPMKANANEVIADLETSYLPNLKRAYPGVFYTWEGEQREQQETMRGMLSGYPLALLIIYALLAIPFGSYLQPFIVMSAIPFGLVGAVWGHVIMGMDLTILSLFGIIALSGVVVNDNLVMVVYINRHRDRGGSLIDAVRKAGMARFRPILLTSLTTFVSLIPLILEKSVQAKFLIPMATSLAFGVVFATMISLLLVPSGYLVLEDFKKLFMGQSVKRSETAEPVAVSGLSSVPRG
ncbi:MAG: Swarming motility protein SwrC [Verrucomicrobia subdivision 3 bacterium]|nr:Swarming motility protein SwrC [Limisphaerales bacterium]MCS1417289.1 Swarming motility protein SwrC [Limisphaerales bacterium]